MHRADVFAIEGCQRRRCASQCFKHNPVQQHTALQVQVLAASEGAEQSLHRWTEKLAPVLRRGSAGGVAALVYKVLMCCTYSEVSIDALSPREFAKAVNLCSPDCGAGRLRPLQTQPRELGAQRLQLPSSFFAQRPCSRGIAYYVCSSAFCTSSHDHSGPVH